jgi:hypothetical protein
VGREAERGDALGVAGQGGAPLAVSTTKIVPTVAPSSAKVGSPVPAGRLNRRAPLSDGYGGASIATVRCCRLARSTRWTCSS